jgi:hypothetical protein
VKLINHSWPMPPKQARYLGFDSRHLGNNLAAFRQKL